MTSPDQILAHLGRTTDQIFGGQELRDRLVSGQPLRIKFGVDCTAPDLHIGHAVNLWMMRYLQDLGHVVVFLIGDTTTRIGDPTGRSTTRPVLTQEEVERNALSFLAQVNLVLSDDPDVFEIRRNSEWYDTMSAPEIVSELSLVTHSHLLSRDMFRRRVAERQEIAMHELIYPVLQGYDSVALESDLTIVGSDQLFNETMGRELQAKHGQLPQTVLTSTITPGLDGGVKQSKSLNNYVGLSQSPDEKFGRLMTLKDELIATWATVYTELAPEDVQQLEARAAGGGVAARDAKITLAETIVARYHGKHQAEQARERFLSVFSERELPASMPDVHVAAAKLSVIDLVGAARPDLTRSAARRLIGGGGVRINDVQHLDAQAETHLRTGDVLQTGRRRWFKIIVG